MPITMNDLTVNFRDFDNKTLLEDWEWLIGVNRLPILVSAIGDAFLQDVNDGSIHWLEVGQGECHQLCGSVEEFQSILQTHDFAMQVLAAGLIAKFMESGPRLQRGEVYSFKVPPMLGGTYDQSNFEPCNISVHFSIAGQICNQAGKLPPGSKIDGFTIT